MISRSRALRATDEGSLELESVVAVLSEQFAVSAGPKQVVRRRRLDTFDGRLRSAGLSLEHRLAAGRQRIAAPGSGEQLVLGRPDGSSTAAPAEDLRWPSPATALPAGPVRDAVAPVIGIRALMVTSDERRSLRRLELSNHEGKTVTRVELDESASVSAKAVEPALLTVRGLRGYDEQARRADRLLVGRGLCAPELKANDADGAPRSAQASGVDRAVPAEELLAGALSVFLRAMRDNLPGLLDDVDTEFLHDFRVAVRRTRATLKLGRPALPEVMRSRWEPAFKTLGDLTTPVRDLDVYELGLPVMSHWLVTAGPTDLAPLAVHLRSRRTVARRALVRSLRSARFRRLVTEWGDELAALADAPQDGDREHLSAGELADRSISRTYRR
ncbi:MAG TPA: CHAD domain-containing protein, partial [Dermatophilaceae bacterium]